MPNENCLKGMKCPGCGSEGPFEIAATAWFTVVDDGTEDHKDVEWDEHSSVHCPCCSFSGRVRDLQKWEAVEIVEHIWNLLHVEDDGVINPDKEWEAELLDEIAAAIYKFKPRPKERMS